MLWKIKQKYYVYKLKKDIKKKGGVVPEIDITPKNNVDQKNKTKTKIIKKSLPFLVAGLAVAIIGAGTIGGTYVQYQNYQLLSAQYYVNLEILKYGIDSGIYSNDIEISESQTVEQYIEKYNQNWNELSFSDRQQLNLYLEISKIDFYNNYPTYNDFQIQMQSYGLTDDELTKRLYNVEVSNFNFNFNYNADQAGVIAGSILLSIGVLTLIISLIVFLKIHKKNKK